ncbi:MAG: sigma-70 factor domain-containing protein, partial [bacterium]|nr:sigma-70 factor domain-containing protein [bacterium]
MKSDKKKRKKHSKMSKKRASGSSKTGRFRVSVKKAKKSSTKVNNKSKTTKIKPKSGVSRKKHGRKTAKEEARDVKIGRIFAKGKARGFVTYDEILKEFPTVEEDITFLETFYVKLHDAGIDVLEGGGLLDLGDELVTAKKNVYTGKVESSYDSIQMYLKEIGQYPLIPGSQEKELAKRIQLGDKEAKSLLAKANLRLVVSIAKK